MPANENTKFINSLFLKNLIESQYGENSVKVKTYNIEPASAAGTDIVSRSSLNRILVRYSSQESNESSLSTVIKLKPTKGIISEDYKTCDIFEKEVLMYQKILPYMIDILKLAGGKFEFAPDLIYATETPTDVLILEDMTNRGYAPENAKNGLDFEQSKMALEKLAFFHASSAIALGKIRKDFNRFTKGTFHADNKAAQTFFTESFQEIIDNGNDMEIDGSIQDKLKSLSAKIFQRAGEDYSSTFQDFKVLNHGDFWTNNILFKYDGGELVDTIFIDFQNPYVGSPIVDLMYFFTTSVTFRVLQQHKDELLYYYHETLRLILEKLEYQGGIPTLLDLQVEFLKHGTLEMLFTLTVAPYLKYSNGTIQPVTQPLISSEMYSKSIVKSILQSHSNEINEQLTKYEMLGLLNWGTFDSKVKGLMGRFQLLNSA